MPDSDAIGRSELPKDVANATDPTNRAAVAKHAAEIPISMRSRYLRAMTGKSRKAGVEAFCAECMGYEGGSEAVRSCPSATCPLFPYRKGAST